MSLHLCSWDRPLTPCLHVVGRASDRLCLSEKLDEEALRILVRSGLEKRFQPQCMQWERDSKALLANVSARLKTELPTLRRSLFEAVLDEVLRLYP